MEGCQLRKTEQTECVAVQCLTLKRTGNKCACKAFADPCRLRQVEIAAASFADEHQSPQFFPVLPPELLLCQTASVVYPPQDDQRAHLETFREACDFGIQISTLPIFILENGEGHQEFSSNPITPAFHLMLRYPCSLNVGERRLSEPDMRQLMREREHLGRLGVCAVDEDQRRQVIRNGKTAKLFRLEIPPVVVQHHTAAHDED